MVKRYCKYCYKVTDMEVAEVHEIQGTYLECRECYHRPIRIPIKKKKVKSSFNRNGNTPQFISIKQQLIDSELSDGKKGGNDIII